MHSQLRLLLRGACLASVQPETCQTHPRTPCLQVCVDQGEVVMMGEEYQADLLRPAWAPGAVAPLPRFVPAFKYTMQYGKSGSNGDVYTSHQPLVILRGCVGPPCLHAC